MKLFKKKVETSEIPELNKIPKKRRAMAIKLLNEYDNGLVIVVNKDIDQKEYIKNIRQGE